ncbi:MAG: RecQ family ATP-dependent DNA helicase [Tannerella sp.]|nr:RecQ family ATP-dependent DNA helicase [Tannerella sp.]
MNDSPHQILERYWGYKSFRPLQEDIIQSVLQGNDTLGLMPTGGGKSLTFQVPAMIKEGLCIVVTPLIALMKDQVDNLRARKIKATAVYSGMTADEISAHYDNCIFGDYKFLYISPERLHTEMFKAKLKMMNISMIVVDESHCISQWGYDFRPPYLRIADLRSILPENVPILALTATATPDIVNDIQDKLLFKRKNVLQTSFQRKNLAYIVRYAENKNNEIIHILNSVPGSAIVYLRNRKHTQDIATLLQQAGFTAHFFHAGLNREEKAMRQDAWKRGDCRIMVATNAFGMGIDKPDVRLVIHPEMPGSLEEYFQEAGRAGRDGLKSYAIALCASTETTKLQRRVTDEFPEKKVVARIYEALCNYFQIADGFGCFTTHDFSVRDFCYSFRFSETHVLNAFKILTLAGYIEYVEDPDNNSRLLFLVTRDELYNIGMSQHTDLIVQTILRSYTGLFSDYVFIDESLLATRTGLTHEVIYNELIMLSKGRVISYIPRKKMPQVIFTQNRVDTNRLIFPQSIYEVRQKRSEMRISKVIEYISKQNVCRSRMLLYYFGEKADNDCRMCDVCLNKTSSGVRRWEFDAVSNALFAHLADNNGSMPLDDLVSILPLDKPKNITILRYLLDNDERLSLKDGAIRIEN